MPSGSCLFLFWGITQVFLGAVGLNILSLGYGYMYALLELHVCLSILWLLNTVPHCYPGKHGAVHECDMASLYASAKLPS
eukprot:134389-Pelagomonas_calceolata.AAC.1